MKYHSNSNFSTACRLPRLLRLIWAKTNLGLKRTVMSKYIFNKVSHTNRKTLLVDFFLFIPTKFEFECVKIALDWAIMRLHFASAMKGEINQFVPYKSLKFRIYELSKVLINRVNLMVKIVQYLYYSYNVIEIVYSGWLMKVISRSCTLDERRETCD